MVSHYVGKPRGLRGKGHAGNVIQFALTPDEYSQMKKHSVFYRVCVVRNALTSSDLTIFVPTRVDNQWILKEKGGKEQITLIEKVQQKQLNC